MLSYEEARNFIEETSKFGSVLGLDSMKALMAELENPQEDIPIIHIAGTNGKGSVGAYLASGFKEAGLVVGRYCSPAVFTPLECWQYDGRNITEEEYALYLSQVKRACDIVITKYKDIQPTVFEVETALAFVYFKAMKVDVLLLETGLGGETDATNVVSKPLACVFTTISRDHMQFLGETLTEIARVKAGIMKPAYTQGQEEGVKLPMIFSATQQSEVKAVLDQRAEMLKLDPVTYVKPEKQQFISQKPGCLQFSYKGVNFKTQLSGSCQMENIALVYEVFSKIFLKLPEMSGFQKWESVYMMDMENQIKLIQKAIASTIWSGRFEVLGNNPLFLIDGAHNQDAVRQLAKTVENCFTNQPIDFIIGILADKEHEKMLEIMMPYANRIFTVTPPSPRGLKGEVLAKEVEQFHQDVVNCDTIEEAVRQALDHSKKADCPILAFGSLSYLGKLKEVYKDLRKQDK